MRSAAVLLLAAALTLLVGSAAGGPRLEVRPQKLEFGSMKRGEKLRKVLYVRNAGDRELVIAKIRPSCTECVVDQPPLRPLAPGQQMELPVTFLASDLPGDHTAYVTFETNDPVEPLKRVYLTVTIEATKLPKLSVEPTVDLGLVLVGEPASCSFKLANIGEGPLHVTWPSAFPRAIRPIGELPKEVAPGAEQDLRFALSVTEAGPLLHTIVFGTDDPEHRGQPIMIRGYAVTREQVEAVVRGVLVTPEDGAARVVNRAGRLVEVSSGSAPEWTPLGPGKSTTVRVQADGSLSVTLVMPSQERSR